MKKTLILLTALLLSFPLHGTLQAAPPLRVVASTTLLEGIVAAVGGDRVAVSVVIPYAMCPGHFDLSPHTAKTIATADLFLQHGFEAFARGLTFADDGPRRVVLSVAGNGMIPAVHREITAQVVDVLCEAQPADATVFQANALAYNQRIDEAEAAVQEARGKLAGVPVLAAVMNAPFVEWTGCKVIGTFPRDEGLSARTLGTLLQQAKLAGVRLIIDNQQSLGRTGRKLADELGVPLIVLSNFPPLENGGYPAALQASLNRLVEIIGWTHIGRDSGSLSARPSSHHTASRKGFANDLSFRSGRRGRRPSRWLPTGAAIPTSSHTHTLTDQRHAHA